MCSAYEGFPPCPRVAMNGLVRPSVLWKCRLIWSVYIQLLCKLSTSCVASVAFFSLDIVCYSSRTLAHHRVGVNKRYKLDTNTFDSNNCNKRYQDFHFRIHWRIMWFLTSFSAFISFTSKVVILWCLTLGKVWLLHDTLCSDWFVVNPVNLDL